MKKKTLIALIILVVFSGIWLAVKFIISRSGPSDSFFCTQDVKLCSDGSYVARIPPECDFAACPKEDLIIIEAPKPNEEISSPLFLRGKARGFWFFEASFPVKLLDENGNLIAQAVAQAKEDWMTSNFVPFEAELSFAMPSVSKGFLVLEKDNPSGLPENNDKLRVPVLFKQEKQVNLFYYNPQLDQDENGNTLCSRQGLAAVKRIIPITQTPIQDAIKLLLSGGLTDEELEQGISTEYPLKGLSLKGVSLKDGVLTLEFSDPENKTVGGSCRVGILWFQIEATAKQFPEVRQVRFLPEDIFQP